MQASTSDKFQCKKIIAKRNSIGYDYARERRFCIKEKPNATTCIELNELANNTASKQVEGDKICIEAQKVTRRYMQQGS